MTLTKAQSVESVEKLLSIAKSTMATGENLLLRAVLVSSISRTKTSSRQISQTGAELKPGSRRVVTF